MQVSGVGVIPIHNRVVTTSTGTLDSKLKSRDNSFTSMFLESRTLPPSDVLRGYYLNQKQAPVSFRGAPWRINYGDLGISSYGSITAEQAIKVFSKLKLGNYLDVGDDKINYYSNKAIRDHNLSFLDRVTDTSEKKKFIDHYKDLTGFPNLSTVSYRIKNDLINAIDSASSELRWSEYSVVQAGYDGVCSVARGKALPGSDVDKAYVILRGGYDYEAEEIVNRFKGKIWENTDQRILSYNHDDAAFPQVYTEKQVKKILEAADSQIKWMLMELGWEDLMGPLGMAMKPMRRMLSYKAPIGTYNNDYVEANQFFIKLCQRFDKAHTDKINIDNPSRENVKNLGFVLEAMREGEKFSRFGSMSAGDLENSMTYNLTNLSQLSALKKRGDSKPKRLAREKLSRDFPNWSIDKQFRLIKTMIHGSCGNNTDFTSEFAEYFSKSGNDPFAPLIRALMD